MLRMNAYAFDTDGTLETSAGPVTITRLHALIDAGHGVAIVSPSAAHPKDENGKPEFYMVQDQGRAENLRAVRRLFPEADRYIYVSDNGDMAAAEEAEFEYIDARKF